MRRVRNQQVRSNNPSLMFAEGIENIIRDHLDHPTKYEAKQIGEKQRVNKQREPRENFFSLLMRQFASH